MIFKYYYIIDTFSTREDNVVLRFKEVTVEYVTKLTRVL